jgi:hypothetical protein
MIRSHLPLKFDTAKAAAQRLGRLLRLSGCGIVAILMLLYHKIGFGANASYRPVSDPVWLVKDNKKSF